MHKPEFYRPTYVQVNQNNLLENLRELIKNHSYQYYFAVVKANCYNHGLEIIPSLIQNGCNYLAVSSIEEALQARPHAPTTPILILGDFPLAALPQIIKNRFTISINSLTSFTKIAALPKLPAMHLKVDTGMNRYGIKTINELRSILTLAHQHNHHFEGLYSHIYFASDSNHTQLQFTKFQEFINNSPPIKIIHLAQSETLLNYPPHPQVNGCRLGLALYGFYHQGQSTYQLLSTVIDIKTLSPNETLGYNAAYTATSKEKIALLPIGYADGLIRANTNRQIYINDQPYPIVGNICMDTTFVKIDQNVHLGDQVYLIRDNQHLNSIAQHLQTIPYEILTSTSARVPITYKKLSH